MKKIKLGVIYGGLSTEHEVSINSAKRLKQFLLQNMFI